MTSRPVAASRHCAASARAPLFVELSIQDRRYDGDEFAVILPETTGRRQGLSHHVFVGRLAPIVSSHRFREHRVWLSIPDAKQWKARTLHG